MGGFFEGVLGEGGERRRGTQTPSTKKQPPKTISSPSRSSTWSAGHKKGSLNSLPGIVPACGAHQRSRPHHSGGSTSVRLSTVASAIAWRSCLNWWLTRSKWPWTLARSILPVRGPPRASRSAGRSGSYVSRPPLFRGGVFLFCFFRGRVSVDDDDVVACARSAPHKPSKKTKHTQKTTTHRRACSSRRRRARAGARGSGGACRRCR